MKKLIIIVISLLPFASFAGGKVIGNGGDDIALEFYQSAKNAIAEVKEDSALYPEIKGVDLDKILAGVEILVSEAPIYSLREGVRQFSTAINYNNPDTIVIYGARWDLTKNASIRKALALHEILSLAGIESTGDYLVSKRYLNRSGINCFQGLCEDLPHYSCALAKSENGANEQVLAKGEIGNKGTMDEYLSLSGEDVSVSISMNNSIKDGHILLALYQHEKKVGMTMMKGTALPPLALLVWIDPVTSLTWSAHCKLD